MDLWLMIVKTVRFHQLTHTADTDNTDVLHPHFSHDRKRLTWTEMYKKPGWGQEAGYWKIKVADFSINSGVPWSLPHANKNSENVLGSVDIKGEFYLKS